MNCEGRACYFIPFTDEIKTEDAIMKELQGSIDKIRTECVRQGIHEAQRGLHLRVLSFEIIFRRKKGARTPGGIVVSVPVTVSGSYWSPRCVVKVQDDKSQKEVTFHRKVWNAVARIICEQRNQLEKWAVPAGLLALALLVSRPRDRS